MESSLGGGRQTTQAKQQTQGIGISTTGGIGGGGTTPHLDIPNNGGSQNNSGGVYSGYDGMVDFGMNGMSMMMMMMNSNTNSNNNNASGNASSGGSESESGASSGFDLNDCTALAESLDAFLSYGDEDAVPPKMPQAVAAAPQPPALQQHQTLQLMQHLQQQMQLPPALPFLQQQQPAVAATMAPARPASSLVNNLFSFHPQLGLVAASSVAGTTGIPTLPFYAVAPTSLAGDGGAAATETTATSKSSMKAPAPPRVAKAAHTRPAAAKKSTAMPAPGFNTKTTRPKAATTAAASSSSFSAPAPVPTLFGRVVALPPVPAPSRPLQLSPWEIEQVKKKKNAGSATGRGGGVAPVAAASSPSSSYVTTTTTPHLTLSQMQQQAFPADKNTAKKRPRNAAGGGGDDISAVSEDDDDREKRRQDRNQREQNRSQQITHQIDHLRNVLAAANVPFKPDKHSTLASVVQYIKELQEQSKGLDEEHSKLLQTITDTTEIMNSQYLPAQTTGTDVPTFEGSDKNSKPAVISSSTSGTSHNAAVDPTLSLLQGVDFKFIFQRCPVASAVTSIDGRFLDCNEQFEQICGFERQELLVATEPTNEHETADATTDEQGPPAEVSATKNLSLFNILQQTDMERVYTAMSHMLQRPIFVNNRSAGGSRKSDTTPPDDMWTEQVSLCRMDKTEVRLTLSLVRSPQEGRPRFFNCVLIAKDSDLRNDDDNSFTSS